MTDLKMLIKKCHKKKLPLVSILSITEGHHQNLKTFFFLSVTADTALCLSKAEYLDIVHINELSPSIMDMRGQERGQPKWTFTLCYVSYMC